MAPKTFKLNTRIAFKVTFKVKEAQNNDLGVDLENMSYGNDFDVIR